MSDSTMLYYISYQINGSFFFFSRTVSLFILFFFFSNNVVTSFATPFKWRRNRRKSNVITLSASHVILFIYCVQRKSSTIYDIVRRHLRISHIMNERRIKNYSVNDCCGTRFYEDEKAQRNRYSTESCGFKQSIFDCWHVNKNRHNLIDVYFVKTNCYFHSWQFFFRTFHLLMCTKSLKTSIEMWRKRERRNNLQRQRIKIFCIECMSLKIDASYQSIWVCLFLLLLCETRNLIKSH